jgi:CheY-like chemotaxis protein
MAASGMTRRVPLILVVDDQDDGRDLLREAFEEHGFAVITASNGKAALERLRKAPKPDLVILDLEMPVMSGKELIDEMTADEKLSDLPVLVFTGNGRMEVPLEGPVVGRLSKPCSLARLLDAVSECLALQSFTAPAKHA